MVSERPVDDCGQSEEWSLRIEDVAGVVVLVGILVAMSLGVFYRYVLNDSLTWPEEAARYGLAYVTFLGLIAAFRRGSHIRIDAVDHVIPDRLRRWVDEFNRILLFAFFVTMTILGYDLCLIVHNTPSAAMSIPLSYAYGAVVVGFGGAALRIALVWLRGIPRMLRR